ncbi:MAG: alpha/beta hydrolase [Proteobacteria bacterium]|nr:alpha/beta hydrolase [Pseudomonadota bacterium]
MPLDPQMKAILDAMPPLFGEGVMEMDPAQVREMSRQPAVVPPQPVAAVEDRSIPGPAGELPLRIYTPEGDGPHPLLVFFHGGGFVICDLDSHDGTCRALCNASRALVVSVDYRLAPEHKFPAAPEDCYAATCWAVDNAASLGADPRRVALAGDSAGGNLTAVVALMARDRGGPALSHQLLIYPVTDHAFDTPSYVQNGEGYMLTTDAMRWFWGHYLANESDGRDPYASPLAAEDLSGLPPASVITAEYDPLRDEGEAYARRLADAGVPTELRRYDGVIHGFFGMAAALGAAAEAVDWAGGRLRAAYGL